jgi:hypothetical protein
MKKKLLVYLSLFLQALTQYGFSQDVTASTGWNYVYNRVGATAGGNLITMKSSMGAVCNSSTANVINYNNYYNLQIAPGGLPKFGDSADIQAAAKTIAMQNPFKADAGKPVTLSLTLLLPIPGRLNSNNPFYNSMINGNITGRIGIDKRNKENVKNKLYDNTITFSKDSMETDLLFRRYYFTGEVIFKRGSTTGYVFITIPVTNYNGQVVYEEFVVPYIVSGPLDEQVKIIGVTTEPQIPYMVLHDPPGDGSTARLNTTTRSCRTLEETFATDESNNVFGSVKIGIEGSIGFVATIDYEIFAEFSAGVTIGSLKMGSTSTENCIAISNTITTSDLDPEAGNEDLFIGYGMDLNYGVTESIRFSACSYVIDTGLIFSPVKGTTREFRFTKKEILEDINARQAELATPGFTTRDSANAQYQINVWNQVLALNDSNITHANETGASTVNFGSSASDFEKTVESSQVKSITVEHYINAEAGLLGVVNIGGSGFSAGYKFNTSKSFGNMGSASHQQSQTIGYHLYDGDAGDNFNVRIMTDPMYGTSVFKLLDGTKSSCPYEGGIQRDQPKLDFVTTVADTLLFPNVAVGQFQSFDLRICNESAESRAYRLRLKNNVNNAVVTAGGNPGPEFTSSSGISLEAKGSANACVTYQVDVKQLNPNTLSFPNLEFELYPICDDGTSERVFATVNYGDMVKSLNNGDWSNPNTWEAKRVPQPTDNVIINSNHTINVPPTIEFKCKNLKVNPGAILQATPGSKITVLGN